MPGSFATFDYEAALAACATGDASALRRLYEQEGAYLLGVVRRIVRDPAMAEDVVHDVFVNVWTRAASFEASRGSARGWLYSVARNQALNAVRAAGREVDVSEAGRAVLDAQAAMVSWQEASDRLAERAGPGRLGHCLARLEPERRDCILHAYVDGLSHGEIAQRLGKPLGTVKAWIKRSLQALRECLA